MKSDNIASNFDTNGYNSRLNLIKKDNEIKESIELSRCNNSDISKLKTKFNILFVISTINVIMNIIIISWLIS